jgi:hypothetical protein
MTAKEIKLLCGTLILLVFGYAVFISLYSHADFPQTMTTSSHMPFLSDKPVGEDGYYMLMIAWNIASGKGVVGNEGESATGIQPLSTLAFSGIAKIVQVTGGTKWSFVRMIIVFGAIGLIVFAFLIGQISAIVSKEGKGLAFAIGFSFVLLQFWLFRSFTYGLETGLYLISLAGLMLFTLKRLPSQRNVDFVIVGLLAGICGWARIDFGVVFLAFLATIFLLRAMTFRQTVIAGIVALLVVAPWFLWVYVQTNTIMPSSGPAQSKLITLMLVPDRIEAMLKVLVDHLTPWSYSVGIFPVLVLELATLVILVALLYHKRINVPTSLMLSKIYISWSLAFAALVPIYIVLFWATHFYGRYVAPLLCVTLPLLSAILTALFSRFKSRSILQWAFFVAMTISFFSFAYLSLHTGKIGNQHSISAGFINEQFDKTTKVGAFQSGVIGFFNENTINLDGKVNHRALIALKTDEIDKYIDAEHISVIIDWPHNIYTNIEKQWLSDWKKCVQQPRNDSLCLIRQAHE